MSIASPIATTGAPKTRALERPEWVSTFDNRFGFPAGGRTGFGTGFRNCRSNRLRDCRMSRAVHLGGELASRPPLEGGSARSGKDSRIFCKMVLLLGLHRLGVRQLWMDWNLCYSCG